MHSQHITSSKASRPPTSMSPTSPSSSKPILLIRRHRRHTRSSPTTSPRRHHILPRLPPARQRIPSSPTPSPSSSALSSHSCKSARVSPALPACSCVPELALHALYALLCSSRSGLCPGRGVVFVDGCEVGVGESSCSAADAASPLMTHTETSTSAMMTHAKSSMASTTAAKCCVASSTMPHTKSSVAAMMSTAAKAAGGSCSRGIIVRWVHRPMQFALIDGTEERLGWHHSLHDVSRGVVAACLGFAAFLAEESHFMN
ncbi:hypothetical protein BDV96DRAFT_673081 [Lophiotrema nucula]|uniref:Uncharacterized protein n=1 Tax=Lophiotrema nucula TaxID=690887 RepID=A0A6A5YKR0_9PLEO|nr:hypothetical protein BDV96DRAFT_673081 [Lophiotrema nucula]